METITILLGGFLDLELECFYTYEPAVPEDDINPPELAVVELEKVYLHNAPLELYTHLSSKQWREIEQRIYDKRESEL
jgi:hypothetical protein